MREGRQEMRGRGDRMGWEDRKDRREGRSDGEDGMEGGMGKIGSDVSEWVVK